MIVRLDKAHISAENKWRHVSFCTGIASVTPSGWHMVFFTQHYICICITFQTKRSMIDEAGSETALLEGESGLLSRAAAIAPKRISRLLIIASHTQQPVTTTGGWCVCSNAYTYTHTHRGTSLCKPCRWLWCAENPSRSAVGKTCSPTSTNNSVHVQSLEWNLTQSVAHSELQRVLPTKPTGTELLLLSVTLTETSTDTVYISKWVQCKKREVAIFSRSWQSNLLLSNPLL